jgi:hypothetical protein
MEKVQSLAERLFNEPSVVLRFVHPFTHLPCMLGQQPQHWTSYSAQRTWLLIRGKSSLLEVLATVLAHPTL